MVKTVVRNFLDLCHWTLGFQLGTHYKKMVDWIDHRVFNQEFIFVRIDATESVIII